MNLVESAARLVNEVSAVAQTCGPQTGALYLGAVARRLPEVLRTRSLAIADSEMRGRSAHYRLFGVDIDLPGRVFSGAREMYCRRVYFANPRVALREGDTVVDLGANVGLFTLLAAVKCQRVIAVEAQSGFKAEIEANLRAHGVAQKAEVEVALVGAASGVLADPDAFLRASHFQGELPPHLTMPELMQRHGLSRIDFLKSDIEGSEFDLFRDATAWLPRVDRIAMEVHAHAGSPVALCEQLRAAGFQIEYRSPQLKPMPPRETDGYIYAYRVA
jgi:FkbM family methyltransferase